MKNLTLIKPFSFTVNVYVISEKRYMSGTYHEKADAVAFANYYRTKKDKYRVERIIPNYIS